MPTLPLINRGGLVRDIEVIGVEPGHAPALIVRWDMAGLYTLDLRTNELVRIQGNRVVKHYPWKAQDIEEARCLHQKMKPKPTVTDRIVTKRTTPTLPASYLGIPLGWKRPKRLP